MISCLNLRTCDQNLIGKYVCYNIPNAENYLLLKDDGTFIHYFKEGNTEIKDEGTWQMSNKGHCIIEFSNWKTFNQDGLKYSNQYNGLLWINYEFLDNGPDGKTVSSFEKLKE